MGELGKSTCQPNKYLTLMNTIKSPAAVKGLLRPASWMCVTVLTCWHRELRGENTESQEGRQNVGQDSFSVIPQRLFFLCIATLVCILSQSHYITPFTDNQNYWPLLSTPPLLYLSIKRIIFHLIYICIFILQEKEIFQAPDEF